MNLIENIHKNTSGEGGLLPLKKALDSFSPRDYNAWIDILDDSSTDGRILSDCGRTMQIQKTHKDVDSAKKIVSKARRELEEREKGYREQALKMFPWICARCGREFNGKKLKMLTVHHKDHNHDNNPRDGSNWELLCLYCHDNEHSRYLDAEEQGRAFAPEQSDSPSTYQPFAGLEDLLKKEK